jgi:hypothetical protein
MDCQGCKAECTPSWKEACDLQFAILKNRNGFYLSDEPKQTYGFGKEKRK